MSHLRAAWGMPVGLPFTLCQGGSSLDIKPKEIAVATER
jgi:hypothetical protein